MKLTPELGWVLLYERVYRNTPNRTLAPRTSSPANLHLVQYKDLEFGDLNSRRILLTHHTEDHEDVWQCTGQNIP